MVRYTTKSFIDKAIATHGTKYDYSKTSYVACKDKLTIICSTHGEFYMTPNAHIGIQRQGCNKCGIISRSTKNKRTTAIFIEDAIAVHGMTYDYSKSNYINCKKKLIVICRVHGEFQITPEHHLRKIGCAKCGTKRCADSHRLSQEQFISQANTKHGHRYDYSKVNYIDSNTKVIIICSEHGEFTQTPGNHVQGSGCDPCGHKRIGLQLRLTQDDFIERANQIHHHKYDYSKVMYVTGNTMIDIICPEHGIFQQKAACHLQGCGCTPCGYRDVSVATRNTQAEVLEKFRKIHGDRYDYCDTEYQTTHDIVMIKCKEHGSFQQSPHGHLHGQGCPRCAIQNNRVSIVSQEWLSMIKASCPSLELEYRIPDTNYFADGYDPSTRTIYEFHGDYWHGNPNRYESSVWNERTKCTMGQLYENTLKKRETCIALGYRYVEIWENTWRKCKKYLRRIQRKIILTRQ
jgi:G:T-mismatch repair DNA endonuclease (very short patch repair protein)